MIMGCYDRRGEGSAMRPAGGITKPSIRRTRVSSFLLPLTRSSPLPRAARADGERRPAGAHAATRVDRAAADGLVRQQQVVLMLASEQLTRHPPGHAPSSPERDPPPLPPSSRPKSVSMAVCAVDWPNKDCPSSSAAAADRRASTAVLKRSFAPSAPSNSSRARYLR